MARRFSTRRFHTQRGRRARTLLKQSRRWPRTDGWATGSSLAMHRPSSRAPQDTTRTIVRPRGRGRGESSTFRHTHQLHRRLGASVTRWTPRIAIAATLALALAGSLAALTSRRGATSIVIVTGG